MGVLAARPSGKERVLEAALTYAEAEEDEEFRRAEENLWKATLAAQGALIAERTRAAMAECKARGIHVGRPHKVAVELAGVTVAAVGVRRGAELLGVSVWTVRRALRRAKGVPFAPAGSTPD